MIADFNVIYRRATDKSCRYSEMNDDDLIKRYIFDILIDIHYDMWGAIHSVRFNDKCYSEFIVYINADLLTDELRLMADSLDDGEYRCLLIPDEDCEISYTVKMIDHCECEYDH